MRPGLAVLGCALGLAIGCSKTDAKAPVKKFQSEFITLHEEGVRKGFFQCLYGEPNLPPSADEFVQRIQERFDSDPAGFIEEKSKGCREALEKTLEGIRMLAAPTTELGTARDAYTDAAQKMIDAWADVHDVFLEFQKVEDVRIDFNANYAKKLEEAGNRGWAVVQKCGSTETLDACMTRLQGTQDTVNGAYRYLNFVGCILTAYDVDVSLLLIEDTKAVEEGRGYLLGVKALRDKLTELCSGEPGTPTHILEWGGRIRDKCFPLLDAAESPKPELFDKMMLWWSSDGARDASGEAYSSYAALTDGCLKLGVDVTPPIRQFLAPYGDFVKAAGALNDAIQAALR